MLSKITEFLKKKGPVEEHPECLLNEWRCKNHECINVEYHCDGTDDCTDRSDETECAFNRKYINETYEINL